jgi:hypothetical protein
MSNVPDDVELVLSQAPAKVTRETAEEALTCVGGNLAEAVALLWDRAAPPVKQVTLDPVQAKWASVRDIADSISRANIEFQNVNIKK